MEAWGVGVKGNADGAPVFFRRSGRPARPRSPGGLYFKGGVGGVGGGSLPPTLQKKRSMSGFQKFFWRVLCAFSVGE